MGAGAPHLVAMDTPAATAAREDRRRLRHAMLASGGFVLLLWACFLAQHALDRLGVDWTGLTLTPGTGAGLVGVLTAPLLHGSLEHVLANSFALLVLGTLALVVYPKATLRAWPLLWLGSGLGAWLLGDPGSHHLGASGLAHGLGFLVFTLGLLRRDRAAIAAGMIGFLFYGGMLLTILPHEAGISWQSHLGGALAGLLAAVLFRRSDPPPARAPYSWELEEQQEAAARERADADIAQFEPPAPADVPVLWQRPASAPGTGTVVPLRRPASAPVESSRKRGD